MQGCVKLCEQGKLFPLITSLIKELLSILAQLEVHSREEKEQEICEKVCYHYRKDHWRRKQG